ncbi:MAG: glycerophosphodiester phosphodiesterase [Proteobacteria bacterium]|nr:glycerophosphodiester phosphodiesterase [Pseudomonadota bacterium]
MRSRSRIVLALLAFPLAIAAAIFSYTWSRSRPVEPHPFYTNRPPEVIAHRGGLGLMPESTLAAFRKSVEIGVHILETDIRMTKDGHLVTIHDGSIDRTTNGTGEVNELTLEELQSYNAAYYFSPDEKYRNRRDKSLYSSLVDIEKTFPLRGKGIKIPTLRQVFETFPEQRMIIEIKQKTPSITASFCGLIREFHKENHILAASFHQESLDEFRRLCPEVATSAGSWEAARFVLLGKIGLTGVLSPKATALQVPETAGIPVAGFSPAIQVVEASFIENAREKNMAVHVWTVNDENRMKRLLSQGVDGIMTDYPDRLIGIPKASYRHLEYK